MVWRAAAGYDSRVAGLDEARARSTLDDMQDRLTRGPMVALGITPASTPEDARAAFLQLTKVYHPVRFGRMATDIQKQANEVFLALRAAHDTVAKTLRRPPGAPAATPAGNGRLAQSLPGRPAERPVAAPPAASGTGPRPAPGRARRLRKRLPDGEEHLGRLAPDLHHPVRRRPQQRGYRQNRGDARPDRSGEKRAGGPPERGAESFHGLGLSYPGRIVPENPPCKTTKSPPTSSPPTCGW